MLGNGCEDCNSTLVLRAFAVQVCASAISVRCWSGTLWMMVDAGQWSDLTEHSGFLRRYRPAEAHHGHLHGAPQNMSTTPIVDGWWKLQTRAHVETVPVSIKPKMLRALVLMIDVCRIFFIASGSCFSFGWISLNLCFDHAQHQLSSA